MAKGYVSGISSGSYRYKAGSRARARNVLGIKSALPALHDTVSVRALDSSIPSSREHVKHARRYKKAKVDRQHKARREHGHSGTFNLSGNVRHAKVTFPFV